MCAGEGLLDGLSLIAFYSQTVIRVTFSYSPITLTLVLSDSFFLALSSDQMNFTESRTEGSLGRNTRLWV